MHGDAFDPSSTINNGVIDCPLLLLQQIYRKISSES
jgi:hypothetical protein